MINANISITDYFSLIESYPGLGNAYLSNLKNTLMNMGYTAAGWTYLADEHHIYGSSRVGVHNTHFVLAKRFSTAEMEYTQKTGNQIHFIRGKRTFELSNHLGNVQVVISDKRISVCDNELQTERFEADILMATDYYPFGMAIPDRQWYTGSDSSNYRYGFNGQEKDNEVSGKNNSLSYVLRIYNARLGKFLSVDPLTSKFPYFSPFQFAGNCPIKFIDLDGAEPYGPPYPAAGTPHLRYTFTEAKEYGYDKKTGKPKKYYKTATAHDCAPSGLAAANKQNKSNGGKGVLVDGDIHNRENARQWQLVDGPSPSIKHTQTNVNTQTAIYNGDLGNNSATTTNRTLTIPSGDAVTSATFSYNNGENEANAFVITDATTGAVIANVPATIGTGSITFSLLPGQTINIQQIPDAGVEGSTLDVWNYSLVVVVTQTTQTTKIVESKKPTVSSPGETVTPPEPRETKSESTSSSTSTENTIGQ